MYLWYKELYFFQPWYEIMVTTLCVKNYFVPELGTNVSADWYLLQIDADWVKMNENSLKGSLFLEDCNVISAEKESANTC